MKKISLFTIAVMIIQIIFTTNTTVFANTKDNNGFVIRVDSLSFNTCEGEKQVKHGVSIFNDLDLDNIQISAENISIDGTVDGLDIKLCGQMKQIDTTKDIIVGKLKDLTNNFNVVHFSFNNQSNKFISALGNSYKVPTLNLYLNKSNTRNYIFIEMPIPQQILDQDIFSKVSSFTMYEPSDLSWFSSIFAPTTIRNTDYNYFKKNLGDKFDSIIKGNSSHEVLPLTSGTTLTKSAQNFHSLTYIWMSHNIEELVWIDAYLDYPSPGNTKILSGTIKKYSSYTFDHTTNQVTSQGTTAKVSNMFLRMAMSSGGQIDAIEGVGGYTTSSGHITLTPSLGFSVNLPIPGLGIGADIGYQTMQGTLTYPVRIMSAEGGAKVTDKFLTQNGDYVYAQFMYSGSSTGYYRVDYTISNPYSTVPSNTMQLNATAP